MFSGLFLYLSVALGVGIDPLDIATILGNALAPTFGPAGEYAWIVISAVLFLFGIWQTVRLIQSYWELNILDKFCTLASFVGGILIFLPFVATTGAYLLVAALVVAAAADGLSSERRRR